MKKILIFIFLSSILGCNNRDTSKYKYKVGDVVYLKPDSTKAIIREVNVDQGDYTVILPYFTREDQIYGKVNEDKK